MLARERDAAALEAATTQGFGWWMYGLVREGGTLEGENYAPATLTMGRMVYDRLVRGTPLSRTDLSRVTEDHVRDWFSRVRGMPRTRARYLSVVRSCLERAVKDRRIPHNPAARVKPPKADEPEIRVLKEMQALAFLEELRREPPPERLQELDRIARAEAVQKAMPRAHAARWRRLGPDTRRRLYRAGVLMLHGLRRGELLGLRHEDYDDGGVWIRRQALPNGDIRTTTKGRRSRWVPLDDEARAMLEAKGEGWVFPAAPSDRPYAPRNLSRDLDVALRLTPFEGVDPHDLRHTHGTLMLRAGIDVRVAADIMGHDPGVLAKVYARSDQDDRKEALARLRKSRTSPYSSPDRAEEGEMEPKSTR